MPVTPRAIALAASLISGLCQAQTFEINVVAIEGGPSPDGTSTIGFLRFASAFNNAGDILFLLRPASVGTEVPAQLWLTDRTGNLPEAKHRRLDQFVTSDGLTFADAEAVNSFDVNDSGDVTFIVRFNGLESRETMFASGPFSGANSATPVEVLRVDATLPATSNLPIRDLGGARITESGELVATVFFGDARFPDSAILGAGPRYGTTTNEFALLSRTNGPPFGAFGLDLEDMFLTFYKITANGEILFRARETGSPFVTIYSDSSIVFPGATSPQPVVTDEDLNGLFDASQSFSPNGAIAHSALINQFGIVPFAQVLMSSPSDSPLRFGEQGAVAIERLAIPSVPGQVFDGFGGFTVNDSGAIAFKARISPGFSQRNEAVFASGPIATADPRLPAPVLLPTDPIPDDPDGTTFLNLNLPLFISGVEMNNAGEVVVGTGFPSAVWLRRPDEPLRKIIREGDIIDANPDPLTEELLVIRSTFFLNQSRTSRFFNDAGYIVFEASAAEELDESSPLRRMMITARFNPSTTPADRNADNQLDFQDALRYRLDVTNHRDSADLDNSGQTDFFDFLTLLQTLDAAN